MYVSFSVFKLGIMVSRSTAVQAHVYTAVHKNVPLCLCLSP